MLKSVEENAATRSTLLNPALTCRKCCRVEYHYALFRKRWWGLPLLAGTAGLILLMGPYRCCCCGTRRLFRFNVLPALNNRKKPIWNPMDRVNEYRDSWVLARWKRNASKMFSRLFSRRRDPRQTKFRKRSW